MILVRITGGLGNQMFQYAAARNLADRLRTNLKLDINEYNQWKLRRFELGKFNINAGIAGEDDMKSFLGFSRHLPALFQPYIHNFFKKKFHNIYYEKWFHFNESFFSNRDNTYLIGFWQSEKYFTEIDSLIRREFTLNKKLTKRSEAELAYIRKVNSVSVNIRRGEFVTDPNVNKRHGVIDLSYFYKAISYITAKIKDPHYFIFSDDIDWVKKYFRLKHQAATFMDFNYPERVFEDLILGSNCKHNIITNSTFSWWVAWLNDNKNKIVIAPNKWFQVTHYNIKDLFPRSWIIME